MKKIFLCLAVLGICAVNSFAYENTNEELESKRYLTCQHFGTCQTPNQHIYQNADCRAIYILSQGRFRCR